MLTSAGQRGDAARCRELGIAVYLVKPIRQSELLEAVLVALGKSSAPERRASPITRHTLREIRRRLQILLAEDNAINQQLAVRLLEKRGHTVTVASNGSGALSLLKNAKFDLVLMDVQMPIMDGFQATAAIRKEEESTGQHLPIIAMTAHAMQGDRERCLEAGMDAYISKPVQASELISLVEEIVRLDPVPPKKPSESTKLSVFDPGEALNQLGGDKELLAELAGIFLNACPAQLADIRKSVEKGDMAGVRRAAHTLKGSVGNFGALRAFDAAFELEKSVHVGDLAGCARLYDVLEKEIESLKSELERLVAAKV
jgi:two-component system, sensor histidine kinase and response regulator